MKFLFVLLISLIASSCSSISSKMIAEDVDLEILTIDGCEYLANQHYKKVK